jgi:hypothetical protein
LPVSRCPFPNKQWLEAGERETGNGKRFSHQILSSAPATSFSLRDENLHTRIHQPLEIVVRQAYQLPMRTGIERNLAVAAQRLFDKNRQAIEVAERRHGPDLAIGESVLEFQFGRQADALGTQRCLERVGVHMLRCRQNCQGELAIDFDDHRLG